MAVKYRQPLESNRQGHALSQRDKEWRGELLESLVEIGHLVTASAGLPASMEAVVRTAARLLDVEHVRLYLYDEADGVLRLGPQVPALDVSSEFVLGLDDTLPGQTLRARRPLIVHRLTEHPLWKAEPLALDAPESGLFVPFFNQQSPLGVLVALSTRVWEVECDDVQLVQTLLVQLIAGDEHTRLYEAALRQDRQLETMLAVNKRLALGPPLDEILSTIVEEAARLLAAEAAGLRLREGDELVRSASFGPAEMIMLRERLRVGESLSGLVAQENQALMSSDLAREPRHDPLHRAQAQAHGFGAWLGVPLRGREGVVGVLFVLDRRTRPFEEADVTLLEAFADQAAIAVENARLFQQEQERRRQLEAIRDVTDEITRELDPSVVLQLTLRRATELVGAAGGTLYLWDEAGQVLSPQVRNGLGEFVRATRLKLGRGVTGLAAQRREGVLINDYQHWQHAIPVFAERSRVTAALAEPLVYRDRLIGVITVNHQSTRQVFREEDQALLSIFADEAAIAIENARLYQELAEREARLRDLVGRLLLAQEEERRRVAYEVHDGLAQLAAATQQHLEAYASQHAPRSPEARRELVHVLEIAQRMVSEARRVIAGLRPTVLDDFGLTTALQMEVELLRAEGWQVTYDERLGEERLPPTVETALFRVVQEALENVRKHARTTRTHLALRRQRQAVRLEVRDWGRGFQPERVLAGRGPSERVGLQGMQERVAWLGGRCSIRSHPGTGTRIVVEVPLGTPEASGGDGC